ncbi:MAG TPA: hypothetical protein VGQ46_20450 [Thermoanaerobaculia bacterium]|jgi:hypothetical protein|nr:hypothetical protein [Thermoanaerobaculia bacterium]
MSFVLDDFALTQLTCGILLRRTKHEKNRARVSLLTTVSLHALTVDEILARFNKVKEKSKYRHGVVTESYLNVRSDLAPSRSGSYEATDFGRKLTLEVHADGTVAGRRRRGRAHVPAAQRTHRRVASHRDEAVRRWQDGTAGRNLHQPAEDRGTNGREITSDHTTFGLGVTSVNFTFGGATFDRLFYERK